MKYHPLFVLLLTLFSGRLFAIELFEFAPDQTKGLMSCLALGYSGVFQESDAQARVFCPSHAVPGWISNKEKIHFLTLALFTEKPGLYRESVGPIAVVENPKATEGLRKLFHSYLILFDAPGLISGKLTRAEDYGDPAFYGDSLRELIGAMKDFRKRNPDFVYDKEIHDLTIDAVWISENATLYTNASTKSTPLERLTVDEKKERDELALESRKKYAEYKQFLSAFLSSKDIRHFEQGMMRSKSVPAVLELKQTGIDFFRKATITKHVSKKGSIKRVVAQDGDVSTTYEGDLAVVLLRWLEHEKIDVTVSEE